jgi:antitoxin component of MazEF toxin-antitoxin module
MAAKIATTKVRIGRVGQHLQVAIPPEMLRSLHLREGDLVALEKQANGVLIKSQPAADPDDILSPEESSLIAKARREMREGKYVALAQVEYDLAHKRPPRRRKTA